MLNYLKRTLQNYFCDNNDHCDLKYALKANEALRKELSILRDKYESSPLICSLANEHNQAVYINLSENQNGIICIQPSFKGNQIANVDLYGYFGITPFRPQGNKQQVYTKIAFDNDGFLYCHIIDFLCSGSCGYGTAMMNVLKKYLQNFSVAYINGWISSVDSHDTEDPEHNERLHHFYKKLGFYFYWSGGKEYLRLNMKDEKKCSKKYLDHTVYQLENSCYNDNISHLLFKGIITMCDLNRTIRINNPNLYLYGLKSAAGAGASALLKTLNLLCDDIESITSETETTEPPEHIRDELISRLHAYVDPLRYHNDNEALVAFAQEAIKKYPQKF